SHLTWLWSRLREQTVFFPWYRASLATRMHGPIPAPEVLHDGVIEFLRAGDHYRGPYGAAFKLDGAAMVAAMKSPAIICASDWDPTSNYLDRLPATPPDDVRVERLGDRRGESVYAWVADVLANYAKGEAPPAVSATKMADGTWQDFADVDGGQLHVRRTEGPGRPLLVQHDAASDNRIVHRVTQSLAGRRPTFAFDLPGNGESDNTIGEDVTVARHADVLAQSIESLGLDVVDFYGMWGGGLPGLDLAVRNPERINRLVMSNVLYFTQEGSADYYENYTFPIEPVWFGGHLVKCWIAMRDQGLFWPWYRRTRDGVIQQEPFVDTQMVHSRVIAMLKAGNMWRHAYRAHFAYPTGDMLGENTRPTLLASPIWDPNHPHGVAAHRAHPHTRWQDLPADMAEWAPTFLPFLDE
ncbi:MAG: alpha/beta hydrolase, partial [Alphaproteobacteria bacterium]|nr:alpha/beta hydrolase [Alphaproteobacteria bacterium]